MQRLISFILNYMTKYRLVIRLLGYILLFSSCITLMATSIQLYLDYREDKGYIEQQFRQIDNIHLKSLANSLWNFDKDQIQLELRGILGFRDIQYLEIIGDSDVIAWAGNMPVDGKTISRTFRLIHEHRKGNYEVGRLTAVASMSGVYHRLYGKALVILFTQGVKTFIVSLFILFIFHFLVTRHLIAMADYARQFNIGRITIPLELSRRFSRKGHRDELEDVVSAINRMRINLQNYIQERDQTEKALRESEARYRDLYDNAPYPYFSINAPDGMILNCNAAAAELVGYQREELTGSNIFDLYDADETMVSDKIRSVVNQLNRRKVISNVELQLKKQGGERIWVSLSVEPVLDSAGNVIEFRASVVDISERKANEQSIQKMNVELEKRVKERTAKLVKAYDQLQIEILERRQIEEKLIGYQKKLRSLSSELSLAEERTRRRISIELHDRIGQALSATKIKLNMLKATEFDQDHNRKLLEICDLIDQCIQDVRSLIFELSPPILYELGLEAAVEWLSETFQEQYNLEIHFSCDEMLSYMDNSLRALLFQSIRELLFNIVKHSQASEAEIKIHSDEHYIIIVIRDTGRGFDPSILDSQTSMDGRYGLFSIRERLSLLDGSFEIVSQRDKGTIITLTAPLRTVASN